jgi:uncharacterized protein (TIGR02246 family)
MRLHFDHLFFRPIICIAVFSSLELGWAQGLLASGADSRTAGLPSVSSELAAQIRSKELAVWEAAKQRDLHRFATLVADDARMVFVSGVMTKQEYMQEASTRTITDYSLEDFQFFSPAKGIVITLYRATVSGSSRGKPFPPSTVRESSVWANRDGGWVAVWNQETPVR